MIKGLLDFPMFVNLVIILFNRGKCIIIIQISKFFVNTYSV